MASLENRRGKWCARLSVESGAKRKQFYISLETQSKVTARQRLGDVNKAEPDIKSGVITDIEAFFPWLNEERKSSFSHLRSRTARLFDIRGRRPRNFPGRFAEKIRDRRHQGSEQ